MKAERFTPAVALQISLGRLVLSCCTVLPSADSVLGASRRGVWQPQPREEGWCPLSTGMVAAPAAGDLPFPLQSVLLKRSAESPSGAYCVYSLEYILPWRWEPFALWKMVSLPFPAFTNAVAGHVRELDGALGVIQRAIKTLILS